jgi:hypothetical protein
MYKVPAPPPSFFVLARLYAAVDSCGARLHKTQHSHLPMDPLQNLDHSLNYNPSTTPDDVQNVYRPQRYVPTMTVMPPPGAVLTHPSTSIFRPQVGLGSPSLPLTGHHDPRRVPTPASTNSPSDRSETSLYDPATSFYGSTSPTLPPSQAYNLRHSLHRKSSFPWLVPRLRRFKNTAIHPLHPQL